MHFASLTGTEKPWALQVQWGYPWPSRFKEKWVFPKSWGYPPVLIHIFIGFFHVNHPAIGVPEFRDAEVSQGEHLIAAARKVPMIY